MKVSRLLLLVLIFIVAASWLSQTKLWKKTKALYISQTQKDYALTNKTKEKLQQKAAEGKIFVQQKKYNDNICFFIDMSLPSGQNRFFIYDLKKDSLLNSGLVAHGNCYEYWLEGRRYSNAVGSGCTSLGKYKIGNPYTGKFGYSYKLYGLDSTNNNAFERTVVLHSHSCVPDSEVADDICQSNGCPTVSPGFLQLIKTIVNTSRKPVLLWVYD